MSVRYSGFWMRVLAYFLDFFIELLLIGSAAFLLELQQGVGFVLSALLLFILSWLYFAGMESSKYQATLGKMLLNMRVVDLRGKRISFMKATARYFAKFLSRLIFGIGYLMVPFTKKKQALHDKIASTLVVKSIKIQE